MNQNDRQFESEFDTVILLPTKIVEEVYEHHGVPEGCRGEAMRVLGLQCCCHYQTNGHMASSLHSIELPKWSDDCCRSIFNANQELMDRLKLTIITPEVTPEQLQERCPLRLN